MVAVSGRRPRVGLSATAVLLLGLTACSGVSVSPTPSSSTRDGSATSSAASVTSSVASAPPDATLADLAHVTLPAYCDRPATTLSSGAVPLGPDATTSEPTTSEPTTSEPTASEPTASEPTTSQPTASEPNASQRNTSERNTSGPSSATGPDTTQGASPSTGATSPAKSDLRPSDRGELVLEGPSAPVLVDVTGDGAKEAVAEYRCDADGTTWPSMVVVVEAGGGLVGHVKLGNIARTEHASVTSWHPQAGGLAVGWVAFEGADLDKRPYENLLTLNGAAVSFPPTERGRALAQTTIVDGPGSTSFVTPTGKIACTLDGSDVTCAVLQPAWTGESECTGKVDAIALVNGRADYACSAGAPFRAAAAVNEPPWQRQGSDPSIHGAAGQMAGVAFGRTITTGAVTCTSATGGVTCSDRMSGHGFTISTDSVRTF